MNLDDFLELSSRSHTDPVLFETLCDFAEARDFSWVSFGFQARFRSGVASRLSSPFLLTNLPDSWRNHYLGHGLLAIDPVMSGRAAARVGVRWDELRAEPATSSAERWVLDEAARFGIVDGLSVALHAPNGSRAVLSVARRERSGVSETEIRAIRAAAIQFYAVWWSRVEGLKERSPLTPRERECLRWCALGKSSAEIGLILAISEGTVNAHFKGAMRKLDAATRTAAVVDALRRDLISL